MTSAQPEAGAPVQAPVAPHGTLAFGAQTSSSTRVIGAPTDPAPQAAPHSAAVDPTIGTQVGSFRVVRLLGRGGMGTVYLAEHPVIGSKVAVKFLHESMAENAQVVARFYDEARAVNLIGHENIVAIYDLNLLPPNRYYFVMEYLEGETLTARGRRTPMEPRGALAILVQLCDALQCAHERGVVHRDLKPDNVFLVSRAGRSDFVKLVDFGIAKLRGSGASPGRTAAGLIIGTPEYMAPEQCDDGVIDARTDVYALGVIAYELFTGRLPFQGRTVPQLLLAHLQQKPPPPSKLVPSIDPGLERLILQALEKDPGARPPDMAAFGAGLRSVLDGFEISAALAMAGASDAERIAAAPTPPPRATPAAAPAAPEEPATLSAAAPVTPPPPEAVPPPATAPFVQAPSPAPAPPAVQAAPASPVAPPPATAQTAPPGPAAAAIAPPPPAAPAASALVSWGSAPPRTLPVSDLTRAGLFVHADADLPPVFSRVALSLHHPALPDLLGLAGEVVRHVSREEAGRWKQAPGFAVQLSGLTQGQRSILAALAAAPAQAPAAPPASRPAQPGQRSRVEALERLPAGDHYALLGLARDAEFSEVRRAARQLRAELEAVRARPEIPALHARATALVGRLDLAQQALSTPAERLPYDVQGRNFLGVARCVAAGIPQAVLEERRRADLAGRSAKAAEAQNHLNRAQMARKLGNPPAALAAYEAALTIDPLDLQALEAYLALRRQAEQA